MTHRWLTRALVAVAVPALLVPAVASSATAATKPPAVPTLAAVTKIYPHLEGGSIDVSREKVRGAGKDCKPGKVVKGAAGQSAVYVPPFDESDDPDTLATSMGEIVFVTAERFPSAKAAHQYLRGGLADTKDCADVDGPLGPDAKVTFKKIGAKLGAERWGFQVTWASDETKTIMNAFFVRKGKDVVSVFSAPTGEAATAPSIPKTVALTKLALKTVG
jgi:hypothetical protein